MNKFKPTTTTTTTIKTPLTMRLPLLRVPAPLLLAMLMLLVSGGSALDARNKCNQERTDQMDACAAKMGFFGDRSFRAPKSELAAQEFCKQLKESINCIQAYQRDCVQGFTRQLLGSLLKRGRQQYSLICQNPTARNEFRQKIGCLTDDKIGQLHDSMDASIVRFEFIASPKVANESRLPGLCCSYQVFNLDVDSTLDRVCGKPKRNAPNTHEFVHKVVSGTAGEFLGLICEGHRTMAECRASSKTSPFVGKLEELTAQAKAGSLKPHHKSLVPVLLEILDSSASN